MQVSGLSINAQFGEECLIFGLDKRRKDENPIIDGQLDYGQR